MQTSNLSFLPAPTIIHTFTDSHIFVSSTLYKFCSSTLYKFCSFSLYYFCNLTLYYFSQLPHLTLYLFNTSSLTALYYFISLLSLACILFSHLHAFPGTSFRSNGRSGLRRERHFSCLQCSHYYVHAHGELFKRVVYR